MCTLTSQAHNFCYIVGINHIIQCINYLYTFLWTFIYVMFFLMMEPVSKHQLFHRLPNCIFFKILNNFIFLTFCWVIKEPSISVFVIVVFLFLGLQGLQWDKTNGPLFLQIWRNLVLKTTVRRMYLDPMETSLKWWLQNLKKWDRFLFKHKIQDLMFLSYSLEWMSTPGKNVHN